MLNKLGNNIVKIISFVLCVIVFVLNIIYVSRIQDVISENVNITSYGIFNLILTLLIVIGILSMCNKIYKVKLSRNIKIAIVILLLVIYIIIQFYWVNIRQATPAGDQKETYDLAVKMYENKVEETKNLQYFELYPQQLTLATAYLVIFKIFNSTNVIILQYCNIISNVMTIIALLLLTNTLSKQYKVNKVITLILSIGFITLPLLSTFVYGDLMSIPMCFFSMYFIIKYSQENKKVYSIISSIFMAIAYILRMNNLIYIIAIIFYIILNLLKIEEKNLKLIISKIIILLLFILISICPAQFIKSFWQGKLELDKTKQYPTSGFIYMGMQESYRANGWYNDYGAWAWNDVEKSKEQYKTAIIERAKYFVKNPKYFINFYKGKTVSMWTENTYGALWYNQTYNFGKSNDIIRDEVKSKQLDELTQGKTERMLIYQKAIVLIIFGGTILTLIIYRKNISNEVILFLLMFIGGFLFHTLWEAKSRYIISYILVLIPVSSILTKSEFIQIKDKMKNKMKNLNKKLILKNE